jgi:phosphoglycerate dehydrogenase-like enzyme
VDHPRRLPIPVHDGKLNVLIARWLEEGYRSQIAAVDPRIQVFYAAEQVAAETKRPRGPIDQAPDEGADVELDSLLREAEVIYGLRFPENILERAPRLKWVQTSSAGVDTLVGTKLWQSDIILTNTSGIHAIPMREHVLGMMLMFVKHAPVYFANKQDRVWEQHIPDQLWGKTLGVVGLGRIGEAIARAAKAFEMRVVATRRHVTEHGRSAVVDTLYPADKLPEMLGESDFVVVTVALTEETRKLIGERELQAMKPTAYIINIARGSVIDEAALTKALKEKWIAGAGLDVFEKEPLPQNSELWTLPNVIITPHVAGLMPDYNARAMEVFCENLRRYLAGQPLINVIDRTRGY